MGGVGSKGVVTPIPIWIGGVGQGGASEWWGKCVVVVGGPVRVSPLVGGYGGEGVGQLGLGVGPVGPRPRGGGGFSFVLV